MDCSLSSAGINTFLPEISDLSYIKKYRYRLHLNTYFLILLAFLESLIKGSFNKHGSIAKLSTLGFLKTKVFERKIMTS